MRAPLFRRATAIGFSLLVACAAQAAELENPPEDPLPLPPADLPLAPAGPVVQAPDAREILSTCDDQTTFSDCLRQWQPPPPPPPAPEPESRQAARPPVPPEPGAPRAPAEPGAAFNAPPPPPRAVDADRATFDALIRAVREAGIEGKIVLPEPPQDGSTLLKLDQQTPPQQPNRP